MVEKLSDVLDVLKPILPLHYAELAMHQDKISLNPDYNMYINLENMGKLLFVTLRKRGELVGYYIGFVDKSIHYSPHIFCNQDIFYVHPDARGNNGGNILFEAVEKEAKRRGATYIMNFSKNHKPSAYLFDKRGYDQIETTHSKYIGD